MNPDYPPLFQPGFHEVQLGDLEAIFVNPFNPHSQRLTLTTRFRALLERVYGWGIPFEVWLDGSFSTEKPNPADIDLLFVFDGHAGNAASPDVKRDIEAVFSQDARRETKVRYGCDVYFITADDEPMRSYWRGWFGFTRSELPKGIPFVNGGL